MKMTTTLTQTTVRNKLEYPSNWNVIFWNDNTTPMGFITYLLKEIFRHEESDAFELMMKIRNKGKVIAGSYLKSIAESKMVFALNASEKAGYPLKITIEKEE